MNPKNFPFINSIFFGTIFGPSVETCTSRDCMVSPWTGFNSEKKNDPVKFENQKKKKTSRPAVFLCRRNVVFDSN